MEIERRWLIQGTLHDFIAERTSRLHFYVESDASIIFSYIELDKNSSIRMREIESAKGVEYVLTVKSGRGLAREESEMFITKNQYLLLTENLYKLTLRRVTMIDEHGIIYECKQLDSHKIITKDSTVEGFLLEVNFKSEEEANNFIPPSWLLKNMEVTYDGTYNMISQYKKMKVRNSQL